MSACDHPAPRLIRGVTLSSTFTDLKDHRAAVIRALRAHGLAELAMENDSAKLVDVIDSSLQMVRDGSAYIGIISKKYGQTPECSRRNRDKVSITELEFNEALRLGRPILIFIMGEDHLVKETDIESSGTKKKKLRAFRERAKKISADSDVHRLYATFGSLDDFKEKVGVSIADLSQYLEKQAQPASLDTEKPPASRHDAIPKAPALYAEPRYVGSHKFVGRWSELDVLNEWALPADPHSLFLFDAIGGNGKSILAWEWTEKHATKVRRWKAVFGTLFTKRELSWPISAVML